jgi:hypothetical protein
MLATTMIFPRIEDWGWFFTRTIRPRFPWATVEHRENATLVSVTHKDTDDRVDVILSVFWSAYRRQTIAASRREE